jgi:hypothetical protein
MRVKFFVLISCIIFFCLKSYNDIISLDITKDEVKDLGNGVILYKNIQSNNEDRFAILYPPLSGLLSLISLNAFTHLSIENIQSIPSGNYSDMVSYMYATDLPYAIGTNIIQTLSEDDISKLKIAMRWKNIIGILGLFYILILHKPNLWTVVLVLFFIFNNEFITYTSQVLCSLFTIITFELVVSTLKFRSKLKFSIIGLLLGLTVSVAGINGLKLNLMMIVAALIYDDLKSKSLNKGFKKDWIIGVGICLFITVITTWVVYGVYLEKFKEVLVIFNVENKLLFNIAELEVIPFYDTFKQTIFEIIFEDNSNAQPFKTHLMTVLRYCWPFIILIILRLKQIMNNQYLIASILILLITIIPNSQDASKLLIIAQTVSIIIPVLIFLSFYNEQNKKKF